MSSTSLQQPDEGAQGSREVCRPPYSLEELIKDPGRVPSTRELQRLSCRLEREVDRPFHRAHPPSSLPSLLPSLGLDPLHPRFPFKTRRATYRVPQTVQSNRPRLISLWASRAMSNPISVRRASSYPGRRKGEQSCESACAFPASLFGSRILTMADIGSEGGGMASKVYRRREVRVDGERRKVRQGEVDVRRCPLLVHFSSSVFSLDQKIFARSMEKAFIEMHKY